MVTLPIHPTAVSLVRLPTADHFGYTYSFVSSSVVTRLCFIFAFLLLACRCQTLNHNMYHMETEHRGTCVQSSFPLAES